MKQYNAKKTDLLLSAIMTLGEYYTIKEASDLYQKTKELLKEGADPTPALVEVCSLRIIEGQLVQLLLENNANPNAPINGMSAFMHTISLLSKGLEEEEHLLIVRLLVRYGANPNIEKSFLIKSLCSKIKFSKVENYCLAESIDNIRFTQLLWKTLLPSIIDPKFIHSYNDRFYRNPYQLLPMHKILSKLLITPTQALSRQEQLLFDKVKPKYEQVLLHNKKFDLIAQCEQLCSYNKCTNIKQEFQYLHALDKEIIMTVLLCQKKMGGQRLHKPCMYIILEHISFFLPRPYGKFKLQLDAIDTALNYELWYYKSDRKSVTSNIKHTIHSLVYSQPSKEVCSIL